MNKQCAIKVRCLPAKQARCEKKMNEEYVTKIELAESRIREPIVKCIELYGIESVAHALAWWLKSLTDGYEGEK